LIIFASRKSRNKRNPAYELPAYEFSAAATEPRKRKRGRGRGGGGGGVRKDVKQNIDGKEAAREREAELKGESDDSMTARGKIREVKSTRQSVRRIDDAAPNHK
jgi:hypothetical protein